MLRFVALLALVAAAYAVAPICNATSACFKLNEQGCSTGLSVSYTPYCAHGTQCIGNACVRRPVLGATCSASGLACYDANWDLSCSGSICVYQDLYGTGDSCKPGDTNYKNGGCLESLSCDATTKKCTGALALNGDCSSGDDNQKCPTHSFCSTTGSGSPVCTARKAAGATCIGTYECDEVLVCTNRGGSTAAACQAPFAQAVGAGCLTYLDCAVNTNCIGGTCRAKTTDGQDCSADEGVCSNGAQCECGAKSSGRNVTEQFPAECENGEFLTQSLIDAYNKMQSCAKSNNCHDYWDMLHIGYSSGPDQCIAKCLKSAFATGYEKVSRAFNACNDGSGSGSGSGSGGAGFIIPSIALLLALIFATLA